MFKNIIIILIVIVLGKIFLNYYNKINMKIIKKDEKDIVKQELQGNLDDFLKETEPNVLSKEEQDLEPVTQKVPEI